MPDWQNNFTIHYTYDRYSKGPVVQVETCYIMHRDKPMFAWRAITLRNGKTKIENNP